MSPTGRESVDLLLAEWVLGRLASEEVPRLAVEAMERGCQSPTVAVLAGAQHPTRADVEDEMSALLRDLRRRRLSELEALKTLVDDCATRIVDGDVEPVAGASRIWSLWGYTADPDDRPELWTDFRPFIGLVSECENPGPHVAKYAADIVEEARALLRRGGLNIGGRARWAELEGRVIAECRVEDHVADGSRRPLHVGLAFTDGTAITLGAASDGQSLQLGSEQLGDYDMAEYGRVEVRREGLPCDVLAPGLTIRAAVPLVDEDLLTIGLRIETGAGKVYVYNWGDELLIEPELPGVVRAALASD